MTAVRAGIELSIKPRIDAIRATPASLTGCALELSDTALASLGVGVGSPLGPCPGSHWALVRPEACTLTPALAAGRVLTDFRGAPVIRFGLSPVSSTFAGVLAGLGAVRALLLG